MSAALSKGRMAPSGYIDLRSANEFVRCRMFTAEFPAHLVEAAKANLAFAANPTPDNIPKLPPGPSYPAPIELIADALRSGGLTLFIYVESRRNVIPLPAICTHEVLRRAGFISPSRDTIGFRWVDFYPRRILDGLDLHVVNKARFNKFAFCFRASEFDDWLANTARLQSWPLDSEPRRGPGRPKLIPVVKSLLKGLITSGQWRQGMGLKELVFPIQSKLKGEKVNRETVKKAMDELYRETGQLEYRYVRQKRRHSEKPRARRGGILR
jgi:hypothetical protein